MEADEQIWRGLKDLAATVGPLNTILVQVITVDVGAQTCDVIDDDVEYYDVRLRPVINGNTCLTIYPKANTWVLIARIEDDDAWQVISVDEAEKITMKVGDSLFEMNEGFLIKRGGDTLKEVLTLIVESVQQIMVMYGNNPNYTKLSQALTKINNLLQ